MKRKIALVSLLAVIVLCLISAVACSARTVSFSFPPYTFESRNGAEPLPMDEGVVLDGYLDEDFWEEAKGNAFAVVSKVSPDVNMTSMVHLTDLGVYFAVEVNEFAVYYNSGRTAAKNTSVEIYFNGFGDTELPLYNIRIVPTGSGISSAGVSWRYNSETVGWDQWPFDWQGNARVLGNINTSTCQGYVCEAFVPWSTVGCENSGYIKYCVAFNHVETDNTASSERTWTGTSGCDIASGSTYKVASNTELCTYADIMDKLVACDEDMTVDGVLDEAVWQESAALEYTYKLTEGTVGFTAKSYTTDLGIYVGMVIEDAYIYYNPDTNVRKMGYNSGLELYFAPLGTTEIDKTCLQLRIVPDGTTARYVGSAANWPWLSSYYKMLSGVTVQGELNAEDISRNVGYTVEVFIPWTELGLSGNQEGFLFAPIVAHIEDYDSEKNGYVYCNFIGMDTNNQQNPAADYATMTAQGVRYGMLGLPVVTLTDAMLQDGYYTTMFTATGSATAVAAAASTPVMTVNPVVSAPEYAVIMAEGNGVYTVKVAAEYIDRFIDGENYTASYGGVAVSKPILYSPISVDGALGDTGYGAAYGWKNGSGVGQTTYTYLGTTGLYLGYEVIDSHIGDNSHLEIYLNFGDDITSLNTRQIRAYVSSESLIVYRYDAGSGWYWTAVSGTPDITFSFRLTDLGYMLELYAPYAELGLTGTPQEFKLLTLVAYYSTATATSLTVRDNETDSSNSYVVTLGNYKTYGEGGFVSETVVIEDICLSERDFADGCYVRTFRATDEMNNSLTGLSFIGAVADYISEIGTGVYEFRLPAEEIGNFTTAQQAVCRVNGKTVRFYISYFSLTPAVCVDFTGGTAVNSGSSAATVSTVTLDAEKNSTEFVEAEATFVEGIDGDENGAIATNNRNGAYTLISGYELGTGDFTVSAWVYVPSSTTLSTGNSTYLFGTTAADTCTDGFRWTLRYSDGSYRINTRVAGESVGTITTVEFTADEWHLFTVVRSGTSVSFYVDGVLGKTHTVIGGFDFGAKDISFGAYVGETWTYYDSTLYYDEISIYSSALTAGELSVLLSEYGDDG